MKTNHKTIYWLGFTLYGLFAFAVFTFYRLPADKILSKAVENAWQGKVSVSAEKISSSIWKGYRLENLTWTVQAGSEVVSDRMESLTLSPHFLRILSGHVPFKIKGVVGKGAFRVNAGFSIIRGLSKGYAELKAFEIHIGDLALLNRILQRDMEGKLTVQADFQGPVNKPEEMNGQATILLEDGALDARLDAFGFRTIPFEKLSLPLSVRNGVATIKNGRLVGPLFTGEIEGQIRLVRDLQVSPFQITATVRPGPSLMGEGTKLPVKGNKPFVFQLEGTISKPSFRLTGG